MNRVLRIALVAALLAAKPVFGSGLIPGLLGGDPLSASLDARSTPRLDSSSFAEPAGIGADSGNLTLEYTAENLLRTRTNGRLTADITTWGRAESLFLPLHIGKTPTTFALSHISSNASAYYDHETVGTELAWKSDSQAWAINHSIGSTRIGIAGSRSSGEAPGKSAFPQHVFRVFSGFTPIKFSIDGRDTVIQVAQPISNNTEVCLKADTGSTSLRTEFGREGNSISIPAEANTSGRGIDVNQRITGRINLKAGYYSSKGSGSNSIYRNTSNAGKLNYRPRYDQLSATVSYQGRHESVWEAGYVSSDWNLHLRGLSLKGKSLGIDVRPFNDRIDFRADTGLRVSCWHLGMQRRISDKWRFGLRYKLATIDSNINADYVGRAIFGLISVSGSYNHSLLNTRFHSLELSTQYARKGLSVEARISQLIPTGSGGGGDGGQTGGPGPPVIEERTKSTGGTSLSLVTSYSF